MSRYFTVAAGVVGVDLAAVEFSVLIAVVIVVVFIVDVVMLFVL